MPKKEQEGRKLEIEGDLIFNHHDAYFSRYHIKEQVKDGGEPVIVSKGELSIKPDFLNNFEPTQEITGGKIKIELYRRNK